MAAWFPVFIDIEDKKVTVVGAGRIATRRIAALLEFGADITVIAPEASDEVKKLSEDGRLKWRREKYLKGAGFPEGSIFVLAATGADAADNDVYEDCRSLSIPVNIASDRSRCDFYFPGIAREGAVTVGVTAGGKDHRLAAETTKEIQAMLKKHRD